MTSKQHTKILRLKRLAAGSLLLSALQITNASNATKSMVDYFLPMPPVAPLVSKGTWGDPNSLPRDVKNGLESPDWCYWDGKIVKSDDGRYHIYCSRWDQSFDHHNGWHIGTKGIHAVSTNGIMGPYEDKGVMWPDWKDGLGHNVVGLKTHDGRYAMVTSEVTRGEIFISETPDGPFEFLSEIKIDLNGFQRGLARYNTEEAHMSNVKIMPRPDGRYMLAARTTAVMISDDGLPGPYKIMNEPVYNNHPVPSNVGGANEDTAIWYAGGLYHILYNNWPTKTFYHFSSEDGIHNWKYRGVAFNKEAGIFRYTDGTYNDWHFIESPTAFTEEDKVTHFKVAVIDVHKGEDLGNDNHRSKIIVIPFDGDGFNADMQARHTTENAKADATPLPAPWASVNIGDVKAKGNTGIETETNTVRVKASGSVASEHKDALRYTYQKVSGDIMVTAHVLSQDISPNIAASSVMLRKSLKAGAPQTSLWIAPNKGIISQTRLEKNHSALAQKLADYRAPYYLRLVKQGNQVSTQISCSNMFNWEEIDSVEIDLGDEYYAGLGTASLNGNEALARVKNLDVHRLGTVDKIISHNLPYEITADDTVKIKIHYETSEPRDITLSMQDTTDWSGLNAVKHTVNGYGVLEFDYPIRGIDPEHGYRFLLNMIEHGGNWETSMDSDMRSLEEVK